MIGSSTKYANTTRTIAGTLNLVFDNDVILLCDTSLGAVDLKLLEIPSGNFNTQYKLYVVDKSNNASVNNITINAPVGFTINNSASAVINVNNGVAIVTISSNTTYNAQYNFGGGGGTAVAVKDEGVLLTPNVSSLDFVGGIVSATAVGNDVTVTINPNLIVLDYATLTTLISTNSLIPSQQYQITDAIFITTYFATEERVPIIITAITNNTISLDGQGIFLNADYQQIGNYSSVAGFTTNAGVWIGTGVYGVGTVTMWNNQHWVNTTGVNTPSPPDLDPVNWTILVKSLTTGFIQEIDCITYDVTDNTIRSRKDKRNNYVENNFPANGLRRQTFNVFQWGNNKVAFNYVIQNSVLTCWNYNNIGGSLPKVSDRGIYGNMLSGASALDISFITGVFGTVSWNVFTNTCDVQLNVYFEGELTNCVFENSIVQMATHDITDVIANSLFFSSGCVVYLTNTLAGYLNNIVRNTQLNLQDIKGLFAENQITDSTVNILLCGANSTITNNVITNSIVKGTINLNVTNINSKFTYNVIDNSEVRIDNSEGADLGSISYNVITQKSILSVVQNNLKIWYNTLSDASQMVIGTNDGQIGKAVKLNGNRILGNSVFSANIVKPTAFIEGCIFDLATRITIDNECNGKFANCNWNGVTIETTDMNGSFLNLNCDFGTISVPTITRNYQNGAIVRGNYNSILVELDLLDPTIYDLATQTLFVPADVFDFAGVYLLTNASGQIIKYIQTLNSNWYNEFFADKNTITFTPQTIAPYIPSYIVAESLGAVILTGRALPLIADSVIIKTDPSANSNAIIETRIFV